ncbi:hypothetical protein HDU87_002628 [Geranomyces variabilis]|uniref:TOG domain-containing protein n=1 Tax=Geranomyces variabilis TaxID=109894 RepID=A0AAD5XVU6_9FUNG|nr:hypothetical protein HDU87_002628 [Geranomyces variabilis]
MVAAPLSFLPYNIAACSSSNDEGDPAQLVLSHPTTNNSSLLSAGWLSERFCSYPQTLVLRLAPGVCRIRKIEVLNHHYMISTKLDFSVGKKRGPEWEFPSASSALDAKAESGDIKFDALGYVSLNDGAQVEYKARELKSIHIDAEGEYLKIVIQKCHVNNLNLYNQVGIVAINIFGEPCDSSFNSALNEQRKILLGIDPMRESASNVPHDNANAALWGLINGTDTDRRIPAAQSLSSGPCPDQNVANLCAAVQKAKDQAVQDERFGDAKVLKALFDKCKEAGEEVTQLHGAKIRAVAIEDYDTAAKMKADITEIKEALYGEIKRCGVNLVAAVDLASSTRSSHDAPARVSSGPSRRPQRAPSMASPPPSPPSSKHVSPPKRREPAAISRGDANGTNGVRSHHELRGVDERRIHSLPHSPAELRPPTRSASLPGSAVTPAAALPKVAPRTPPAAISFQASSPKPPPSQPPPPSPLPAAAAAQPLLTPHTQARASSPPVPAIAAAQKQENGDSAAARPTSPPVPAMAAAQKQENDDNAAARPTSPPVPALAKSTAPQPKWYEQEFPDPDAPAIAPKVKRAPRKVPVRKPMSHIPPAAPKRVETAPSSRTSSPPKDVNARSPVHPVQTVHNETTPQKLPPGYEAPEPIPDHQATEYALSIEAFGMLLVQCLLGKQFPLREWAMGEISKSIVARTAMSSKRPTAESPLDANDFAEAAYMVVQFAIADNREKAITGSIVIWDHLIAFCEAQQVPFAISTKHFDTLVPIILAKSGDMNTRVKQSSMDMMVTLGKHFHTPPYSIYPYIFKLDKKTAAHWKLIKARLEILHRLLETFGVHRTESLAKPAAGAKAALRSSTRQPAGGAGQGGLPTVAAVMAFTEPFLSHMNVEVRAAAVRVVVDVMRDVGEEAVAPYLKKLNPQQLASVRTMFAEGEGAKPAAGAVKAHAAKDRPRPWAVHSAAMKEEKTDTLSPLESELVTLREQAGSLNSSHGSHQDAIASVNAHHPARSTQKQGKSPVKHPTKDVGTAPPAKRSANWTLDRTCIFCGELDEAFVSEDSLDTHYWKDCCVLTHCPKCKLIVEIPLLTDHLVRDCESAANVPMRKCPRCTEAVKNSDFAAHTAKKKCRVADPHAQRCPLCHVDVEGGEQGWRDHLVTGDGCSGSERKPKPGAVVKQAAPVVARPLRESPTAPVGRQAKPVKPTVSESPAKKAPSVRPSMLPRLKPGASH